MKLYVFDHLSCSSQVLSTRFLNVGSDHCSVCGSAFGTEDTRVDPFPFTFNNHPRNAIVMKPSCGPWRTFHVGDDLHIGIADGNGAVCSFWTEGIVSEPQSWEECVAISAVDGVTALRAFRARNAYRFTAESYDEQRWNCFDFIVEFFNFACSSRSMSKLEFTTTFVEEGLRRVTKFLRIYREVDRRGGKLQLSTTDCYKMAESLEDVEGDACVDRANDANSFLNNQFDIFVHDYRELTEGRKDDCCGGEDEAGCSHNHSNAGGGPSKKDIINTTRRIQKAVFSLQSLPESTAFADLLAELTGLHSLLSTTLAASAAEFSPSNVALPDYDEADMQLLLGEAEVAKTTPMLEKVAEEKAKAGERLQGLLFQAEILLREVAHEKNGVSK